MRFAIISVTEEGKKISNNIASILENDPTTLKVDVFHKNVNKTMKTFIHDYDCWIVSCHRYNGQMYLILLLNTKLN